MADYVNGHTNMNLKNWLIYMLNCSNFKEHGLEWIPKEKGSFKIIWVEKDKPGWEVFTSLLQAWALNKDGERKSYELTKLRARFRDALRNSNYIDIVDDEQNLQSWTYRIYRFLSNDEVKAKKERLKKKPSIESSEPSSTLGSPDLIDLSDILDGFELDDPLITPKENNQHQIPSPYGPLNNQLPVIPVGDVMSDAVMLSGIQPPVNPGHMEAENYGNNVPTPGAALAQLANGQEPVHSAPLPVFENLEDVMRHMLTDEEMPLLSKFEVTLHYEKNEVIREVIDLAEGRVFRPHNQPAYFAEFNFAESIFPPYNGKNSSGIKALNGLVGGFALQIDPSSGMLMVLRRSKIHIFYLNSENNETAVKLEKNEETLIFSYLRFIEDMLRYNARDLQSRPDCEVMMVFGTRPKSPLSKTVVSLTLKPVLAEKLNACLGYSENNLSLLFSDEDSLKSLRENFSNIASTEPVFQL